MDSQEEDCPIRLLQTPGTVELIGRMRETTVQPTVQTQVGLQSGVPDYRCQCAGKHCDLSTLGGNIAKHWQR